MAPTPKSSEEEDRPSPTTSNTATPPNEKAVRMSHHDLVLDSASSVGPNSQEDINTDDFPTASRIHGVISDDLDPKGLKSCIQDTDSDTEPPMTFSRAMSLVAMAFLWTGSQIPIYMFGGISIIVYTDIGGSDRYTWMILGNLLALAAVCPFVGAISDLLGRRYVAIFGTVLVVLGQIICSTAHSMNNFICGMVLSGAGAGINELTALAATSELAPTRQRGKYVAGLIFTLLPFTPSVLWAQLIAQNSHWRFVGLFCGVWNFLGLAAVCFFYFPPHRTNSSGLTNWQIFCQIDFVGGLLSISGIIIFVAGLLWAGSQYDWNSPHVVGSLIVGALLLIAFCFWEVYGAAYPMFPSRLKKSPRILILTLVITFISGANFFSVLLFWPSQASQVYGHSPVGLGLRGLPAGCGILFGACIVLFLLSHIRGGNRWLMIGSSVLMTAGTGALAAATEDNIAVVYICLVIAGLGIGGIVVPASIITTIICPDDLIATVAALTLAIRVIGGAIGYTTYYNIFINKFQPNLVNQITIACVKNGITSPNVIEEVALYTSVSMLDAILLLPGVDGNVTIWENLVKAGQHSFAMSYPYVYYATITYGVISIIASCFMEDISEFMDDHVAVVMH